MTINTIHNDILSSLPILLIYPTGVGGEHLAHTISICSDEFQPLITYYNKTVNQFHTSCFINYSADITNIEDFNSALHECYTSDYKINNKRLIFKDHPTVRTLEFYKKHLPDIKIIFILPFNEHEYFAKLTFKKLAKKINSWEVTSDYIKTNIIKNFNNADIEHVIAEVNKHNWVWVHEIHNLVTSMRNNTKNTSLHHYENIDNIINDHRSYLININDDIVPYYKESFNNFHLLNCDDLKSNSLGFWKLFQEIEPSIDVNKAANITNNWIRRNNELK